MPPLFTIVTVTLNPPREDFLVTLRSLMEQECGDWELIIKDGGSRPGALDGIPDDPRIRLMVAPDLGIYDAMNKALDHVSGEWVCFLNAGDFLCSPRALALIRNRALECPDAEFLYTDVLKPQSRSGLERYPDSVSRRYLFSRMICHQAWFVRFRYYQAGHRYEKREASGSDRRFLLRMMLRDQVRHAHVPHALVSYKGGGLSQKPEIIQRANLWVDELLREIYPPAEYASCRKAEHRKLVAKRLLYDSGAWRLVRAFRKLQLRVSGWPCGS